MLQITSLTALCDNIPILHDLTLAIQPGTVHALMGPNGSGKSTFAHALIGHPQVSITQGAIFFKDQDITHWTPDRRACQGIFLSFQHSPAIPGVRVIDFLKEVYRAINGQISDLVLFEATVSEAFRLVGLDIGFMHRNVNEGFSGGEKKRFEMAQCFLLNPSFIILDELDSGLDIDALRMVSALLHSMRVRNPDLSILIITHYRRILDYINPAYIHVLYQGTIVESGDHALLSTIEEKGYDGYKRSA